MEYKSCKNINHGIAFAPESIHICNDWHSVIENSNLKIFYNDEKYNQLPKEKPNKIFTLFRNKDKKSLYLFNKFIEMKENIIRNAKGGGIFYLLRIVQIVQT